MTTPVRRTSGRSTTQDGDRAEPAATWRKSSRSTAQGAACVEVAALTVVTGVVRR